MKNRLEYNESGAKNEMQRQSGFRQGALKRTGSFWEKKDKIGKARRSTAVQRAYDFKNSRDRRK